MRPTNYSTTSNDAGFSHWKSPIPYLFVGLGLMLGLIAMALLILACSYRSSSSGSPSDQTQAKEKREVKMEENMEPKIVVIMAGNENPTYLAKPASCSCPIRDVQV